MKDDQPTSTSNAVARSIAAMREGTPHQDEVDKFEKRLADELGEDFDADSVLTSLYVLYQVRYFGGWDYPQPPKNAELFETRIDALIERAEHALIEKAASKTAYRVIESLYAREPFFSQRFLQNLAKTTQIPVEDFDPQPPFDLREASSQMEAFEQLSKHFELSLPGLSTLANLIDEDEDFVRALEELGYSIDLTYDYHEEWLVDVTRQLLENELEDRWEISYEESRHFFIPFAIDESVPDPVFVDMRDGAVFKLSTTSFHGLREIAPSVEDFVHKTVDWSDLEEEGGYVEQAFARAKART